MRAFTDYPGDTSDCLDGLVLAKEGFESELPHHLRVCKECLRDLRKKVMPSAALANGLWVGDLPEHLADSTWVELAAASPVRTSGMVISLEQRKVGNIAGSAQRMMGGTFTFFFQNAYGVEKALPSCDADIAGSMAVAIVGQRPTDAQLRKLSGLLTVAFQGKQAASVGGSTVHSVCDIGTHHKGALDNTDGQAGLSARKSQRWAQLGDGVIAMEEISMISCNLLGKMQEAAASVRPSGAGLPHAGYICVTFGDLNQVCVSLSHVIHLRLQSAPT